jgi:hypothetical protein
MKHSFIYISSTKERQWELLSQVHSIVLFKVNVAEMTFDSSSEEHILLLLYH